MTKAEYNNDIIEKKKIISQFYNDKIKEVTEY